MKVKVKTAPTTPKKSYSRCVGIGEAISEAWCYMKVAEDISWHLPVPRHDSFTWTKFSGALQSLRELKKTAPGLDPKIKKVEKETKALQYLVYRTPAAKEKIRQKFMTIQGVFLDLRRSARDLCSDPPQ